MASDALGQAGEDDVTAVRGAVRLHASGFLYHPLGMLIVRISALVVVLAAWETYARGVSIGLLAPPSRIAAALYRMVIEDGTLIVALEGTIGAMIVGLGLAITIGIPLGLLMGRSRPLEFLLDPYVTFLYVIPSVAFVPVLVVILGLGLPLRLALIFLSAVFPLMINTTAGVKHVDQDLIDAGRSFCASEFQIMRTIVLPATVPFIFAGLRMSISSAWVAAIVAEMTATITGVGGVLLESASRFRTAEVFVAIFGIMIVAVAVQWLAARLQSRLTRWRTESPDDR